MRTDAKGKIKPLDPADPHNPDHPLHKRKWLELAAALGRLMADLDYDRLHQKGNDSGKTKDRSNLR
jgi:hypothetical protein